MCWVMPPASVATTEASRIAVQQRRLAVVDVTHDRDHRRPRDKIGGIVVVGDLLVVLVGGVLDRDLPLQLSRQQLHGVVGQRHGQRHHLPQPHHHRDDAGGRDAEGLGQILDGDP